MAAAVYQGDEGLTQVGYDLVVFDGTVIASSPNHNETESGRGKFDSPRL